MSVITISTDLIIVAIKTLGAELISVKDNSGREYIWQADPAFWAKHSPVLFPIVGRVRCHGENEYIYSGKKYEMGRHGFAKLSKFEVEKKGERSVTLLLCANDYTRAQYPFEFEFRVVYTIDGNRLKIDYITDNLGEGNMYYSAGSHEGFAIRGGVENYSIVFDEEETLSKYETLPSGAISEKPVPILNNEREIKLCEEYFAIDALIFLDAKSRGVALRDDRTGEQIHVSFPSCETLLVWKKPNASYVCIEPWAGAPDLPWKPYSDFSRKYGIRTLKSGERETITHTITF